jgi:hypothetical protein
MTKKRMQFTPMEETVAGRRFYMLFGALAIAGGVMALSLHKLHYQNYRGDNVFAPFAIVIGVLAIMVSIRNRKRRSTQKPN